METIFGKLDKDHEPVVQIVRDPVKTGPDGKSYIYDGFVIRTSCHLCDLIAETGIKWKEAADLLKGKSLPNVTNVDDGWTFSVLCPKCHQQTRIFLDHYELYTHRSMHHVSKRIRDRIAVRTNIKNIFDIIKPKVPLSVPFSVHSIPRFFRAAADVSDYLIQFCAEHSSEKKED